jgi:hypothetical protein
MAHSFPTRRSSDLPSRRRAAALGTGLAIGWILLLRFGTPLFASHVFTWLITSGTLVLSVWAQRVFVREGERTLATTPTHLSSMNRMDAA